MASPKTKPTDRSLEEYLSSITPETKQEDCRILADLLTEQTGFDPVIWGNDVIGFGEFHYKTKSTEGDWFYVGLAARKANITIHLQGGFRHQQERMEKLGKHKASVGCLYIKRLADVDIEVLKEVVQSAIEELKKWDAIKE